MFLCDKCGKEFVHLKSFSDHCRCHDDQEFACPICGNLFPKKIQVGNHQRKNEGKITTKIIEGVFECSKCTYSTNRER